MTRVQGPAQVMCRVYSDHCPVTSGDHETWSVEDSSGEGGDQHMRGRDTQGHPGHSSCEVSSSLRVLMWSLKVMELNYIWDCVTPACTSHHCSSHFSNNIWHFKKYFSPFFFHKEINNVEILTQNTSVALKIESVIQSSIVVSPFEPDLKTYQTLLHINISSVSLSCSSSSSIDPTIVVK